MAEDSALVQFDVLVAPGEPGAASETAERAHPTRERIEECRRWFAARGASCHATSFGLACSMPRESAEEMFGTSLEPGSELAPPSEIADAIEQITIPMAPELF
jgi:hypothetical protein